MLLARSGKIIEARHTLDEASSMLSDEVRDQYLILNNTGAVELLTDKPDFSLCCEILSQALKFACDDFSELTILINLGLSYLGTGNFSEASNCADKCWAILNNHDFADTNIYWPACFNMSVVYSSVGNSDKAKTILKLPFEEIGLRTDDSEYWEYRYGMSSTIPESHRFLATKEWHPVYLSHWLIDLEGLALLKVAIR